MDANAQDAEAVVGTPAAVEDEQQEVIYLVVDENQQGQQVTQIVSDGQLLGQQAQIIMQDGKQAVLITEGNEQQVVLLEDEVGPEAVQTALQQGAAVQQTSAASGTAGTTSIQGVSEVPSVNGGQQVQYLMTETGELIMSTVPVTQQVTTQPEQTTQSVLQQQPQLIVTSSGLVRADGTKGKTVINQPSVSKSILPKVVTDQNLKAAAEQVVVVSDSPEKKKQSLLMQNTQTTLRELIHQTVDTQLSEMNKDPSQQQIPHTVVIPQTVTEAASSEVPMDNASQSEEATSSKDETETIPFVEEDRQEPTELVITEPGTTSTTREDDDSQGAVVSTTTDEESSASIQQQKVSSSDVTETKSVINESGMLPVVSSDIAPLSALPEQVMQGDEEKSADESADEMAADQSDSLVIAVSEAPKALPTTLVAEGGLSKTVPAKPSLLDAAVPKTTLASVDELTSKKAMPKATPSTIKFTSSTELVSIKSPGKTKSEMATPSTVITVISPGQTSRRKSQQKERKEDSAMEFKEVPSSHVKSPPRPVSSTIVVPAVGQSIAARRERRTSKPTRYYGLTSDYEGSTTDIYRSYRKNSESGDEAAKLSKMRESVDDSQSSDFQSADEEVVEPKKRGRRGRPKKVEASVSGTGNQSADILVKEDSDFQSTDDENKKGRGQDKNSLSQSKDSVAVADSREQELVTSVVEGENASAEDTSKSSDETPKEEEEPTLKKRGRPARKTYSKAAEAKESDKILDEKTGALIVNKSDDDQPLKRGRGRPKSIQKSEIRDKPLEESSTPEENKPEDETLTEIKTSKENVAPMEVESLTVETMEAGEESVVTQDVTLAASESPPPEDEIIPGPVPIEEEKPTETVPTSATEDPAHVNDLTPIDAEGLNQNDMYENLYGMDDDEVDKFRLVSSLNTDLTQSPTRSQGESDVEKAVFGEKTPAKKQSRRGQATYSGRRKVGRPKGTTRSKEQNENYEQENQTLEPLKEMEKSVQNETKFDAEMHALKKEISDLKFLNGSLESRLGQQSGSPEEIRSLQSRIDKLQTLNNQLRAQLKEKSEERKFGINIKGMKFSVKKTASPLSATVGSSTDKNAMKQKELDQAEQELRSRETQLEKKEMKSKALDRELDERSGQLTIRESKLDRLERKLKSQEKEIEYKEKQLKRFENDFRDLGGQGSSRKSSGNGQGEEVRLKELEAREKELEKREAEVAQREKLVDSTEAQLLALNKELTEKAEYLKQKEDKKDEEDGQEDPNGEQKQDMEETSNSKEDDLPTSSRMLRKSTPSRKATKSVSPSRNATPTRRKASQQKSSEEISDPKEPQKSAEESAEKKTGELSSDEAVSSSEPSASTSAAEEITVTPTRQRVDRASLKLTPTASKRKQQQDAKATPPKRAKSDNQKTTSKDEAKSKTPAKTPDATGKTTTKTQALANTPSSVKRSSTRTPKTSQTTPSTKKTQEPSSPKKKESDSKTPKTVSRSPATAKKTPQSAAASSKTTSKVSTPAKVTPAKMTPAKSTLTKSTSAKSTSAKSIPARSTTAKVTPAKVTPAKGTPAKVTTAKVTPAKSTTTKATLTKSASAKKPAKKTPAKLTAKSPVTKSTPAKSPATKKSTPAKSSATKKATPAKSPASKTSAKKTPQTSKSTPVVKSKTKPATPSSAKSSSAQKRKRQSDIKSPVPSKTKKK